MTISRMVSSNGKEVAMRTDRTGHFTSEEERYEMEHPELKRLYMGDENYELLKWADDMAFIALKSFRKNLYYTEADLDKAIMWNEKLS